MQRGRQTNERIVFHDDDELTVLQNEKDIPAQHDGSSQFAQQVQRELSEKQQQILAHEKLRIREKRMKRKLKERQANEAEGIAVVAAFGDDHDKASSSESSQSDSSGGSAAWHKQNKRPRENEENLEDQAEAILSRRLVSQRTR